MTSPWIRAEQLHYHIQNRPIIKAASFEVRKGECIVLSGKNGSGKSTLLKLLVGLLKPHQGETQIYRFNTQSQSRFKKYLGYLPDTPPLLHGTTVLEYLEFIAKVRHIPKKECRNHIQKALEVVNLEAFKSYSIEQLSLGMQQRLGIAQAIIHTPPVLVLDEPTKTLDTEQIVQFKRLIQALKPSTAILCSLHQPKELEGLMTQILTLENGQIYRHDNHLCET